MASSIALIRLLQTLLKRNYRQSKVFDKYKIRFLIKLQSTSTNEGEIELFDECTKQLEAIPDNLEDNLSEGRLIFRQSTYQLQLIDTLSSSIKDQLKELKRAPEPYSVIEHQVELRNLIKIYQRAVIELSKCPVQSEAETKSDIEFINDELQLLILELDVGQDYVKRLDQLRITISNESDPFKLPHHCLQVINIIIDSTREERRTSRHFLYTLNDSLTQFYLNFAQTLKIVENDLNNKKKCFLPFKKMQHY